MSVSLHSEQHACARSTYTYTNNTYFITNSKCLEVDYKHCPMLREDIQPGLILNRISLALHLPYQIQKQPYTML